MGEEVAGCLDSVVLDHGSDSGFSPILGDFCLCEAFVGQGLPVAWSQDATAPGTHKVVYVHQVYMFVCCGLFQSSILLTNMIYQRFDSIWHQQAACDHQTGTINDCEILSHKAFAV